ncbi:MAG: hypothetical protein ACRC47_08545, partial [Shewanella sp.]
MLKKCFFTIMLQLTIVNAMAEENSPYTWSNALTLESVTNLKGGIDEGTRNLANLDLTLAIDTQAANWSDNG